MRGENRPVMQHQVAEEKILCFQKLDMG